MTEAHLLEDKSSRWYDAAMRQKAGRITAAGMTKAVSFEPVAEPAVDGGAQDRIDEAYRAKYRGSSYVKDMIGARAATVRIVPHQTASRTE
jgi:hypothetical protein